MIVYILLVLAALTNLYLYNSKWKRDRDINNLKDANDTLKEQLKYFEEFSQFLDPLNLKQKDFDRMTAEEIFRKEQK